MAAHGGVPQNVPVGLINQGATCYLDSLLQVLYMTPEFRNIIYSLSEEDLRRHPQAKNLPYQLLRLFLQLQTSKSAVETIGITDCLGIKVSQQRDVQEFWHEMFEILQQQLQQSCQGKLIKRLYTGELEDYVKCLECWEEESHPVAFLEVPLTLKPYDHATDSAVKRSLEAFVAPQGVDGEDASYCPRCDCKRPALKGLRFTKLPPILTLMLMRYTMTEGSLRGQKINARIEFPEYMELGYLIGQDSSGASFNLHPKEHTYELFAILLHYGSTTSGDYFAYIKYLITGHGKGQWFCFNDSLVTPIAEDTINNAFGEDAPMCGTRPYYSSSANAYTLMYRRCDNDRDDFMNNGNLPDHVLTEIKRLALKEKDASTSPIRSLELYPECHTVRHAPPAEVNDESEIDEFFKGGRQSARHPDTSQTHKAKPNSTRGDRVEVRDWRLLGNEQATPNFDRGSHRTSSVEAYKSAEQLRAEQEQSNAIVETLNANENRIKQRQHAISSDADQGEEELKRAKDREMKTVQDTEWKLIKRGQ